MRKKKREWFHFIHYLLMSLTLHKLSFVWSLQCLPYQSASILVSMFTLSFSILRVISIICAMSRSLQYEYINLAMYVCLMSNNSFQFSNPFMSIEYFVLSQYIDPDYSYVTTSILLLHELCLNTILSISLFIFLGKIKYNVYRCWQYNVFDIYPSICLYSE